MNKRKIKKALKRIIHLPGNKILVNYMVNKGTQLFFKISKSTKVAYPSTIMLELTNQCNLACTSCPREYDFGREMDKGMMNLEKTKIIIDEVWPYLDSLGLTGMGETFLYKDLEEVIDYVKSKNQGIIISVSTNAVVSGFIERVSNLINKIDTIQISIDGLNDVYELIRKNASFQMLDENIRSVSKMCRNTGTDLVLNMVVTRENHFHMPLLVKYAKDVGIEYLDFTLLNLASLTNIERSYYDFYKSPEFRETLASLEEAIRNTRNVSVTNRNFYTLNNFQKCPFPWSHFYICWNGFVTPCCAKPFPKELNFGNVFEVGLLNVLNSDSFREFRQLWYDNISPEFCEKCHFIDVPPIETKSEEK
jgi:radical SAM protein with 4Fe4S-binding SPASM domain